MSIPTDGRHSGQSQADSELRRRAEASLGGAGAAVLLRADGSALAANVGGRTLLGAAGSAEALAAAALRLLPTLRADRPARLERLRLPGRLTPAVFACSLVAAGSARAVLMVTGDVAGMPEPSAEPAAPDVFAAPQPFAPTPPAAGPASLPASATAAAAPSFTAPAGSGTGAALPQRFTWRTGLDARLSHVDPRLADALGWSAESLGGHDWQTLGAPGAHRAVLDGLSFNHLPVLVPTARGDALDIELGGAPIRGEGMRGFGVVRGRRAAPQPQTRAAPPAPPAFTPAPIAPAPFVPPAEPTPPPAAELTPFAPQPPVTPQAPLPPPQTQSPPPAPPVVPPAEPASPEAPPAAAPPSPAPPSAPNVVQLHGEPQPATPSPTPPAAVPPSGSRPESIRASWEGLSTGERNAFREIARALGARLEGEEDAPDFLSGESGASGASAAEPAAPEPSVPGEPKASPFARTPASQITPSQIPANDVTSPPATPAGPEGLRRVLADGERPVLDRLPLAMLAFRGDRLLYANRALLDWTGHADLAALEAAGGLAGLFGHALEPADTGAARTGALTLLTVHGEPIPVEARLISAPWEGGTAMLYVLHRVEAVADERLRQAELALREAETSERELRAILDTATDGVVLIDTAGAILSMNHPAEALFGFEAGEVQGENFTMLFAPESRQAAVDYLDGLASNGVASVLNDGREVIGRVREGGLIPLFMTVGRIGEDPSKFCAVLRDITQWKRAEEELTEAKQLAERANLAKSDFLAKISHEIRTPLNAIIGFSEVMMEERFGPIDNQRYRDYLRDIHASGGHLISLINDLLDLSKIEAGKLDLSFTSVPLNEIVQQCMGIMQPQANRERIIIRSSLAADLPQVVADARSIRQIVLNLVSNSIKFTRPGGQVILSTALTENGEVVLRVRDTGIGMSEADVSIAMEPFRQLATSGRSGSGGTGLGLPLTKALAEANRASFNIRSAVDVGTIVEITFPSTRVLAS
ncbi:PAS domain-containing sensor histidine kinase [Ancylobacter mangrovi]|uniref:PAS domain-containing sensor histidine kinase n=1 Tax=Ancylobacter mangrovi TaxID=2972472 RepID=UPI00216388EF|nr:PAS domain S-box protein [Ancylobacter mangrovi]MCS0501000.1 PAS domain S-box protein [Ancylobacter mangrovi]